MNKHKFNAFGFNLDDLGKVVDDFVSNVKVNDIFGADFTRSTPAINAIEHKDYLELQVAAPGLSKEVFELSVEHDVLTISANSVAKDLPEEVKIRRKEFNYATFKRTFTLTNEFDYQKIKAKYEQGVLLVTIPKKEQEESSKIKVEVL